MNFRGLTFALACLAVAATGCSKSDKCTPSTSECLGTQAVLVCPSDGSGWTGYSCASWETCNAGVCKAVDGIDVACTAGTTKCVNDRVLSVCVATGVAPTVIACQEGELCQDGACKAQSTCTAGATECVSSSLIRTCAADGMSWVPSGCDYDETCDATANACVRRTDIACEYWDSTCVDGVPFVCKKDGSGFDTTPCPSNTHCVEDGRCQGNSTTGCVIGATCSDNTVVSCADGKTTTYTVCAAGHYCLADNTAHTASCKQAVCDPYERVCGNPADPTADVGTFVSTCKADGTGWTVGRCEANSVCSYGTCQFDCLPGTKVCSDNSIVTCNAQGKWDLAGVDSCDNLFCHQLDDGTPSCWDLVCLYTGDAGLCTDSTHFRPCKGGLLQAEEECNGGCSGITCSESCVDGETRCSLPPGADEYDTSYAVETCVGGKFPGYAGAVACNDPLGTLTYQVCVPLSEVTGARKAVCGDPECAIQWENDRDMSGYGHACTADGQIRNCEDGKLGAPQACPTGTSCRNDMAGAMVGCWEPECTDGETSCATSYAYVTCIGGVWGDTYTSCGSTAGTSPTAKYCYGTGEAPNRTATCTATVECNPGEHTCTADGLGVRTCQANMTWDAGVACTYGTCYEGTCTAQCVPGAKVCGGVWGSIYGQTASDSQGTCDANGRMPTSYTACPIGTACRTDYAGETLGCVECVGSRLYNGFVDSRCQDSTTVAFCGDNNTWAAGASANQTCGVGQTCYEAYYYSPAYCGY